MASQRTPLTRGPGLALLLGLVVGIAVGVGIGALVFGGDDGSGSGSVGTSAIALPDSVGTFREVTTVVASKNPGAASVKSQQARLASTQKLTEAAYTKAYGGAASAFRQYSDPDLLKMPYVIAVRGPAPQLEIGPVTDPAFLEQGANNQDVKIFGAVSCEIVREEFTPKGQAPDPAKEHITLCERTSPKATVFVGGNSFVGPADMQTMVNFTNTVFTAVTG
jgi:hypothetical protein